MCRLGGMWPAQLYAHTHTHTVGQKSCPQRNCENVWWITNYSTPVGGCHPVSECLCFVRCTYSTIHQKLLDPARRGLFLSSLAHWSIVRYILWWSACEVGGNDWVCMEESCGWMRLIVLSGTLLSGFGESINRLFRLYVV